MFIYISNYISNLIRTLSEFDSGCLESPPNWELLNPQGYRFYLPGGVAPAWYDPSSTALPYDPYLGVSSSSKVRIFYNTNL